MKWVRIVIGAIVAVVAVVWIAGLFLPRAHSATSRVTLKVPRDSVFAVLRDFASLPAWHKATTSSTRVAGVAGERWRQEAGGQAMELDVVEANAPSRIVVKIVEDAKAMFGGTWTYRLDEAPGGGTLVSITEEGWIGPPPFRVVMAMMGANRTMDDVLVSLGARFGEAVTPGDAR
ncbi:MAG: SRPBCC family protein [Gemmatimonadetes bacterium]|nr:SRPBCC family protein [Gemmatimonadota bacterium]